MKKVVYPVLASEMRRNNIKRREIAASISLTESAFSYKIRGDRRFSVDEAIKIQETWFPDIPVNELFKKEKEENE